MSLQSTSFDAICLEIFCMWYTLHTSTDVYNSDMHFFPQDAGVSIPTGAQMCRQQKQHWRLQELFFICCQV